MCSILAAWEPQLYTAPDWFTPPTLALQMVVLNRVRPISTHPFQKESSRGSLELSGFRRKKREQILGHNFNSPAHHHPSTPSSTIQHHPAPAPSSTNTHPPARFAASPHRTTLARVPFAAQPFHRPSSYNTNMEASAVCDSLSPDTAIEQLPPHDGMAATSSHTAVEGLPGGAATAPLSSAAGGLCGAAAAAPDLRQIFADDRSGAPTEAAQPR